jgi:hypothetical protein
MVICEEDQRAFAENQKVGFVRPSGGRDSGPVAAYSAGGLDSGWPEREVS